ncbi:MAG: hypothetical protein IPK84_00785 [Candidatus Moraniibacteriota bacterium]|nr:MAG: hypothetical protein IPK84_00785 [Candidatus Moranbacteria bacterium]
MKTRTRLLVALGVLLVLSGCAGPGIFQGNGTAPIVAGNPQSSMTPLEQCEPTYRIHGVNKDYRQCLTDYIIAGLSDDQRFQLKFSKAFPQCVSLIKSHATLDRYGRCQELGFAFAKQKQLVKLRVRMAKKDRRIATSKVSRPARPGKSRK